MTVQPFINEFHYDNIGTDVGEFIEIAGLAGTDLSQYFIVRYNGTVPTAGVVYTTPGSLNPLAGVIPNFSNGYGTLSFALPTDGLQNGGNDGFALVGPGNVVVEFLSYEGVVTASGGPASGMTSVDVGVSESTTTTPVGASIGRVGTGTQASDFTWANISNDTPGAVNVGQSFGGVVNPAIAISDFSGAETNVGTTIFTFTLTRSGDVSGAASVSYATADATALAASDYAATAGTVSFAANEVTKTVTVAVNGDTVGEANETFVVNLSNAVGATISDAQGVGTIQNDDVALIAIHTIQGAQHSSAFAGQSVTTSGIVTAVGSNGFYIQDPNADNNDATSEAIFVFTNTAPPTTAVVGNLVQVGGTVSEFFPGGASTGNLSTTEITSPTVVFVSAGNALPTATIIGDGGRAIPTETIQDDTPYSGTDTAHFDPANDGMDFYESLEGMLVTVHAPRAVAGTNEFGEIFTVADNGANATGLSAGGVIVVNEATTGGLNVTNSGPGSDFNPERIQIDSDPTITGADNPLVDAGAVLNDVTGVLSYNFGNFEIVPTAPVTVATPSTLTKEVSALQADGDTMTVASFNLLNLDVNDSPGETQADQDVANGRFASIANIIVNNLGAPDVLGLQEIQDNSGGTDNGVSSASQVLAALVAAIDAAGGPHYSIIDNPFIGNDTNGGQPGGNIRNVFLYNDARVDLVAGSVATTVNPTDQQTNSANPFYGSRPPLAATFSFNGEDVTVINNHFASKGGSTPLYGTTQLSLNGSADQRLAQAQNVANYVTALGADKNVLVLGDLNEFSGEESLQPLKAAGLVDMITTLPKTEQYSYVFDGNAQVLDHIFASGNLAATADFDSVHVNPAFAFTSATASDHDPQLIALNFPPVNAVPVAVDDVGTPLVEDSVLAASGTVLANDTDADLGNGSGEVLTVSGVRAGTEAAGGSFAALAGATIVHGIYGDLTLNADGSYSYALANDSDAVKQLGEGQHVSEAFTYLLSDSKGATDAAQLTFDITGNDPATYGSADADRLVGTSGDDVIKGLGGNDKIYGNEGNDVLLGGLGRDLLDGGDGIDTASYAEAMSSVSVSLLTRSGSFGEAVGDSLLRIENLTGSAFADVLVGNRTDNTLHGGLGDDSLDGSSGNDMLFGDGGSDELLGGMGIDMLTGGQGADTFLFLAKNETGKTQATADTLLDFVGGEDRIDLASIDANSKNGAAIEDSFTFIGSNAFGKVAGELHYEVVGADSYVSGDINGDGKADFMIHLTGVTSLSAADFWL